MARQRWGSGQGAVVGWAWPGIGGAMDGVGSITLSSPPSSTRGPRDANWWTDRPSKTVQIRYGKTGTAAEPAQTVVELFESIVIQKGYGEKMALAVKRAGEWKTWTYKEYYDEARAVAKAFIQVRGHTKGCLDFSRAQYNSWSIDEYWTK